MNIAIILAAGNSSRFNNKISKILYKVNNKPLIKYSTDLLCKYLDQIIIVTNSSCRTKIKKLFGKNKQIKILTNDIDTRIESIKTGLDFIKLKDNPCKVLIHDAARPFITHGMIENLLISSDSHQHSQYYLKLVNGLVQKTIDGYDVVDRKQYIELCTPQIIDYHLFNFLFRKYIYPEDRISCEILPLLNRFNISNNLIEGNNRYLRKISTTDDIY
jgi:2-C-methyl-D-erythritol 4-phosphate cytidylyltransferase